MDKRSVEKYMPLADDAIKAVLGGKDLEKTYRSKLSAFGAAVIMSGLLPAVAYYEKMKKRSFGFWNICIKMIQTEKRKAREIFLES